MQTYRLKETWNDISSLENGYDKIIVARDVHLKDKMIQEYEKVITVMVIIVAIMGGEQEWCFWQAPRKVCGVARRVLVPDLSAGYKNIFLMRTY